MIKRIVFRHMDHVPDIENYANTALERVIAALEGERSPIQLDLILEPGRPHAHHRVELMVLSPSYDFVFSQEGPHMYQLLDKACDEMYDYIHRRKKELVDERKRANSYKGA